MKYRITLQYITVYRVTWYYISLHHVILYCIVLHHVVLHYSYEVVRGCFPATLAYHLMSPDWRYDSFNPGADACSATVLFSSVCPGVVFATIFMFNAAAQVRSPIPSPPSTQPQSLWTGLFEVWTLNSFRAGSCSTHAQADNAVVRSD